MTFREFLAWQESIPLKPVVFRPGAQIPSVIPKTGFQNSGARAMSLVAAVNPHVPKGNAPEPIFRKGKTQQKSRIANRS